jgi:hypothetical protein
MSDRDPLKQAKAQGYSAGYAAAMRRRKREADEARRRAQTNALWQRAALAALPFAMTQKDWTRGDKPISSIGERVVLAGNVADAVVEEAIKRQRLNGG